MSTSGFRIQRKKVGLTYSCPVDADENPVGSAEDLKTFLVEFGELDYLIATENHASGTKHFHANLKYSEKIDSRNERLFDFRGVHPNIVNPGKGWESYCAKHGDFITNYYEGSAFSTALKKRTWSEASDLLWSKEPKWMLQHAGAAEKHFAKRAKSHHQEIILYGPCRWWVPRSWDPKVHALVVSGETRIGKTQAIKHILRHMGLTWLYVKGSLARLRHFTNQDCVLFDDVKISSDLDEESTNSLFDIEGGGCIKMSPSGLYDIDIPPMVPRIFINNCALTLNDPYRAVEARMMRVEFVF